MFMNLILMMNRNRKTVQYINKIYFIFLGILVNSYYYWRSKLASKKCPVEKSTRTEDNIDIGNLYRKYVDYFVFSF